MIAKPRMIPTGSATAAIQVLKSIRTRLRITLAGEAVGRLLIAVIAISTIIAGLDWFVRFPALIRLGFLAIGLAVAAVWSCRRIGRPLLGNIPLDELALGLKTLPSETRDELASAVAYLSGAGDGSDELWRRVFDHIGTSARSLKGAGLLDYRKLVIAWLVFLICMIPLAGIRYASPDLFETGMVRVFHPLAIAEWPRSKEIVPLTRDAIIALGEGFTAEMKLNRGDKSTVRAYLHWTIGSERHQSSLMRRDADGVYRLTLDNLRAPLRYYFTAGDDDTLDRSSLVRVVARPEAMEIRLDAEPPPYARHLSSSHDSLDDREADVLEGSRVTIGLRANKFLPPDAGSEILLTADDGAESRQGLANSGGDRLVTDFTADKSIKFEPVLVDGHGLRSRGGEVYRLLVRPDELPTVAIQRPESLIEATPDATIQVRINASDDVGLAAVALFAGRADTPPSQIADLLGADSRGTQRETTISYEWALRDTGASVGEVIEYFAEARDGFDLNGRVHEAVRSPVGRIRIVSASRIAEKLRLDLLSAREQMRRLLTDMQGAMKRTAALELGPAAKSALSEAQKAEVRQLSAELDRLGLSAQGTADSLMKIVREAQSNGESQLTTAQQARRLAGTLVRESVESARLAQEAMARAGELSKPELQSAKLRESSTAQGDFADSMRSMLAEMERWNQYDDLVRQLRELLDRQESLEREFMAADRTGREKQTDGAAFDAEQQRTEASLGQALLRSDAADLLASMDTFSRTRAAEDRLAAESVRAALVVANQEGVLDRMDEAAGAGQAGQFARAVEIQRNAAAGLRAVLAALDSKPDRELAELSRDLKNIMNRLERLIASEQSLIEKSKIADRADDPGEAYEALADRQDSLQSNSRSLEKLIKAEQPDARSVRSNIRVASKEMESASGYLETLSGEDAVAHELAAEDALEAARDELTKLEQRVDQEIGQRSLDAIVEALRAVRAKQQAIRAETSDIASRASTDGDLTRPDMLRVSRLGRLQRELSDPLMPLVEKIKESIVYAHVLEGVIGRIEKSATLLMGHGVHPSLIEQDRIIRDLGWLIESVDDKGKENDPNFVQDSMDAGGGAAGQPTASKPVPTLAELKVLKSMQVDMNDQTVALSRQLPEQSERTEAQLRQIELLGQTQIEIRDLATKMIIAARQQGGQ